MSKNNVVFTVVLAALLTSVFTLTVYADVPPEPYHSITSLFPLILIAGALIITIIMLKVMFRKK